VQFFRIARDGKRLRGHLGNRSWVERAYGGIVCTNRAAHLHGPRAPLFERRIV
jgi:hypothetical protein